MLSCCDASQHAKMSVVCANRLISNRQEIAQAECERGMMPEQ